MRSAVTFTSSASGATASFATPMTKANVMRRIVVFASSLPLLLLCWATPGNAQDDYARNGFYVGLAGTYAIDTFEDDVEDDINAELVALGYVVDLDVEESFGINGRIGYRFHRNFSAEFEVEWLDGFESDVDEVAVPLGKILTIDVETVTFTGNAKGYLLTGRYQPFLLVGLGVMTAETKVKDTVGLGFSESDRFTDFAMRFGGGLDLYATENVVISVGADYVLPVGDVEDLDYVSIGWGFQYRF